MPHAEPYPIEPPSTVIVTGANGYIATHVIDKLLFQGFRVVGTVRSEDKAELVKKTHAQASQNTHLLSTAIVADITDANAYISVFQETQPAAVLHLAAPFSYTVDDFEKDLMKPAVYGTEAVFKAASQIPSIRRIVHTNSFNCICDFDKGMRPGYTYTANDWCPMTYEDGVKAPNVAVAYRASKAAAEKAGRAYMQSNPQLGYDMVSLCPGMVFGPFLSPHSTPTSISGLNTSNQIIWSVVSAGENNPVPPTKAPVWVDVRDVAEAHVRSLTNPSLGGRRLMLAKSVYCNQEIADVTREVVFKRKDRVPIGNPGQREDHTHFGVDSSQDEQALGFKFRGLDECLRDLVPQLYQIEENGKTSS